MTKTPSLRTALNRALFRALICTGAFFFALMYAQGHTPMGVDVQHPTPSVERPVAKGSPEAVLSRMGDKCWTGDAPADVTVPGHVVYSNDATGAHVGGPRMVGIALDSIFKKSVKGLTVYAFCR